MKYSLTMGRVLKFATIIAIALSALYPISIGPVVYWDERYHVLVKGESTPGITAFYNPLFQISAGTPIFSILTDYMEWSEDLAIKHSEMAGHRRLR
ncbi:MAG: hypothetical protein ABJF10_14490 [Chthoniobacter sp.]|uniref:hypothetical protein n=1 Tax=Chthoniobacter sp. TaxID=2510640 RepID=UPI0032AB9E4F